MTHISGIKLAKPLTKNVYEGHINEAWLCNVISSDNDTIRGGRGRGEQGNIVA